MSMLAEVVAGSAGVVAVVSTVAAAVVSDVSAALSASSLQAKANRITAKSSVKDLRCFIVGCFFVKVKLGQEALQGVRSN